MALRPANGEDLRDVIAEAVREGCALEPRAGGSKREIGAPDRMARIVDLTALSGVIDYEPSELVLTVRPSTLLSEVEALLGAHGQMLAFDPWDHGPLFGRAPGAATIGGIVSAGISGPRRVSAGGARDHLLGFEGVSGRGEIFRAGGKVVKNVTGYDLSKLVAGSWGQLVIMTELTLKVVPRPRTSRTVWLQGLEPSAAVAAMAKAMGSPCAVAAAGHLHGGSDCAAITALRLEGFVESVEARTRHLCAELATFGFAAVMSEAGAAKFWRGVPLGGPAAGREALWRVHLPPSRAADFVTVIEGIGADWLLDWAGALAWVGADSECAVRSAAEACGGHAMLVRGAQSLRTMTSARQPEPRGIASLSARLKQAFDPAGILDPLRFS